VIVEDVASAELFRGTPAREVLLRAGIRAVQSTPLVGPAGKVYGMMSTHYRRARRPAEPALRYLDLLASQAGQVLERLQYAEIERRGERLRASAELARSLAHEISNPAQALTNILKLLSGHEAVQPEGQPLVQMAREQLDRMSETLKKMLAVEHAIDAEPDVELSSLVQHVRGGGSLRAQRGRKLA
jgi:signal transduction histidine kinase